MKSFHRRTLAFAILASFVFGAVALAQDIPLNNWTVPPYRTTGAAGGLSTMADVTPAISFVGVLPCRLVDTRMAGFPAGYGTPSLTAGVPRNFDLNSQPNCTGIPSGVEAYSLNFTVTQTLGPGFLKVYPQGGADPGDVSTINYVAGQTIANAAIVPAGAGGGITVIAGVSGTQVIIDINGYFTDDLNTGVQFVQVGSVNGAAVIIAQNNSSSSGSHAIGGFQGGLGTNSYGVEGQINTNAGSGSAGVHGIANTSPNIVYGGEFENASTATESAGVIGDGDNVTGETYGVFGDNDSSTNCAAGVFGRSGGQLACNHFSNVGVLGTNSAGLWGVLGLALSRGTQGSRVDAGGNGITFGVLGYLGNSGVHSFNDITAAGAKPFVEPHPVDPSKQLVYVALEGAEAGTYFRGRAKFERGMARIAIPEHFRMLTEPEGLSIQITPIGEMTTFAVMKIDLDEIVVRGSRNVEFFYTVNGVRHNYKDFNPVQKNVLFVPTSASDTMFEWPETHRRTLIQNGTLTPAGQVNRETARRLGWEESWEKDQLRIQAQKEADREADQLGLPEGSVPARLPQ
jgi:hypothetical protein